LTRYLYENGIRLTHIFFNDSSIFALFFCKIAGAKVIESRRDLGFWYTPLKLALLKMNRLFVDCVIANSKAVRDVVCNKEGYCSEKICVIYNGHDLNRFKSSSRYGLRTRFNIPPGAPIIGMVANFHKYKRHEDLIDAFSIVHKEKPEAHLVLIGDGERVRELKNRVAVLDLNQVVHFTGKLSDVIPAVQEFSICVLCSATEGFSNALIEYMGCGTPVVATKVGGNAEIIQDGVNGYLVTVGEKKELANRILLMLKDSNAANGLGSRARETTFSRYSFKRMLNSYLSLYKRLVNNKNIMT
jgi:glycosyltransferase involved in cell wall biosynthesis